MCRQRLQWERQGLHRERRLPPCKAEVLCSGSCPSVEVDLRREKSAPSTNAQCGVIDSQWSDAFDRAARSLDGLVKLIERPRPAQSGKVVQKSITARGKDLFRPSP